MAKNYRNLYEQIIADDNIYLAWRKARRGKRYKSASLRFEMHLDETLLAIKHDLHACAWHPGGYRSFTIHEPKRRKISAAPFRDRVVHHALCNVIVPIYERKFIYEERSNSTESKGFVLCFCDNRVQRVIPP